MKRIAFAGLSLGVLAASACGGSDGGTTPGQDAAVDASVDTPPSPTDTAAEMTEAGPAPGETRTDPKGVEQVWVPAGSFIMGSDDATIAALRAMNPPSFVASELASEQPAHDVHISKGFWIDRTEVTNAGFQAFKDGGGYDTQALWSEAGWAWLATQDKTTLPKANVACHPMEPANPRVCITWHEAEAFAHWRGGRLPTEAEWEYAARGPESRQYPWGNDFDPARANVVGSKSAVAVGGYPDGASWVGALDMAGNAMEWVADWLDPKYYATSPKDDPSGPATGKIKVEKGGWWGSNLFVARAAYRHYEDPPTYQDHHIGVRVVTP